MKAIGAVAILSVGLLVPVAPAADKVSPREALKPFNELVGRWKGTGNPEGVSTEEKRKGFWIEQIGWEWQFKGEDVWIRIDFQDSKHFTEGELRYLPEKKLFRLQLTTLKKEKLTFEGPMQGKRLILDREDEKSKETQRLVLSLLHETRFLYHYEVKPADRVGFKKVFQVGATRKGVAFATGGETGPECIVSGGKGTSAVTYKGKTYYVCCSGCRDEFRANPEKYIKEYEEKQKAKKNEK